MESLLYGGIVANRTVGDVFISYSRFDRPKAEMLAKVLEREGWSVWWDPKIPPGKKFGEVIEEELKAAKCVVVLWSRKSVRSEWVKEEASEGKRRRILVPVFVQDKVKPPLGFGLLQTARLTDWKGEGSGHQEFDELKKAITAHVTKQTKRKRAKSGRTTRTGLPGGGRDASVRNAEGVTHIGVVPEGVYYDSETKLMWTIEDNGKDINWHEANEYAKKLVLGGFADWRLPTIEEIEAQYDPKRERYHKIREPLRLTGWGVWSSTKNGTDSAWGYGFGSGRRVSGLLGASLHTRVFCVRRS